MIKKMHWGGLAADEVPIITQTGERILSRSQNKAFEAGISMGGGAQPVQIHIHAVDARSFVELCQRTPNAILSPLIENINRSGSARNAIQGAF